MSSFFGHIKEAPPDPILSTTTNFKADPDKRKVSLGVGAYRTELGKPYVLPVIAQCERELLAEMGTTIDKEYSPIDGPPELKKLTQALVFGADAKIVQESRVASCQALSGTGSLRVAGEFISTYLAEPAHTIYMSDPTWGNHPAIFKKAGMQCKTYRYFDAKTKGLNFEGMMEDLRAAPLGSTVLLHACAHNPTGVDPSEEQWKQIADLVEQKKFLPIMDNAYQGYASGDLDYDAKSTRLFAQRGMSMILCQSFAKNLGLYGERMGMIHIVCPSAEEAKNVLSQVKLVIRPMYSSPPIHGAQLLVKVLGKPAFNRQWQVELKDMAKRILEMRSMLRTGLEKKGTPGPWNHITDQIGMFSYTGLSEAQCERLTKEHHIYLLKSGRISLAGLNKGNIQYMIDCVDEVVRKCPQ